MSKRKTTPRDHIIIPDPQLRVGVPSRHLTAAGNLIAERQPEVIVIGGDFWDFPSLSRYRSELSKVLDEDTVSISADFQAGVAGLHRLLKPFRSIKNYNPLILFLGGNHEDRLDEFRKNNLMLAELLPSCETVVEDLGITYYAFLEPVTIDGISYCHYFRQEYSGNAVGTASSLMSKYCKSCTAFHKQGFDYKINGTNKDIQCLITGSFYLHDEAYKTHTNNHWRGLVYKHSVYNGGYDLEQISTNTLLQLYGE